MIEVFAFFITCGVLTTFLTPRVFRWSDSVCARKRFNQSTQPNSQYAKIALQSSLPIDQFFDSLARSTRSNQPTRDALMQHSHMLPNTSEWAAFTSRLHDDSQLTSLMGELRASRDEDQRLLTMAFVEGSFSPDALEHASHIVRERRHIEQSLVVATAQARLTMRILTLLPIAVLAVGIITSSAMRSTITSPAVAVLLILGFLLNRVGAWWVSQSVRRSLHLHQLPQSVALVESLCVAIRAGHSPTNACLSWEFINLLGQQVAHLLNEGATLAEALRPLTTTQHQFDSNVAHTLTQAHSDGLPLHSSASLLVNEARSIQRAEVESQVRQLSTRLSMPLVLCVLPSFCLLTLAPLFVAHLSRFGSSLPSPIS